jgi:hypothetical protein
MNLARVEPPSEAIAAILAAAYAQLPTADEAKRWRKLSKMKWPKSRPRRVAACIGRRGLKTSGILAWSAIYETLCGGHEQHAAPGSRIYALVIAPRQKQAREAVLHIRAALDSLAPLGVAYEVRDENGAPEIVITSPPARCERVIAVEVCNEVSVRSRAVFFLGCDEAGRWPSEEWLSTRDEDVVRAARGAMIQFPGALEVYASNPGKPGSYFHGLVTKPTAGTLVVQAASWVTNPRITRERCWEDAEGIREVFEQEYEATRWGASGGSFLDSGAVWGCLGSEHADKGPRRGAFLVGYDQGQTQDAAAIVAVSSFEVEVSPTTAPVRHVVVEHAESIAASKKAPLPTAVLVARLAAVSRAYGKAAIVFDQFCATDVKDELRKLGYREHDNPDKVPPRGTFMQVGMAPQHQTPRWLLLRGLVNGRRLHLGEDDEPIARELSGLRATELSSGALKVEGKVDNQADALAITLPLVIRMAVTDGPAGAVKRDVRVSFDPGAGGLDIGETWYREGPNGSRIPAEMPRWAPGFEAYAREMIALGTRTPGIAAWEREQEEQDEQPKKRRFVGVLPF